MIVPSGRRLDHRYRLANPGPGPITILEAINRKPCCGAVRVEKMVLGPGEAGSIDVDLQVGDKLGAVVHEVELVTDLPSDGRIVLRTSAVACPKFRVEEDSMAARAIPEGTTPRTVEFTAIASGDRDEPPLDLDRVALRSTEKVAWVGPKEASPDDGGLTIESRRASILLDAGTPGPRKAEVRFEDGDRTLSTHAVNWEVIPAITTAPKVVVKRPGEGQSRIIVRSHDQRSFRILKVDGGASGLRGRVVGGSASLTQVVEIEGEPGEGRARGSITLSTDHPSRARVDVPFVVVE